MKGKNMSFYVLYQLRKKNMPGQSISPFLKEMCRYYTSTAAPQYKLLINGGCLSKTKNTTKELVENIFERDEQFQEILILNNYYGKTPLYNYYLKAALLNHGVAPSHRDIVVRNITRDHAKVIGITQNDIQGDYSMEQYDFFMAGSTNFSKNSYLSNFDVNEFDMAFIKINEQNKMVLTEIYKTLQSPGNEQRRIAFETVLRVLQILGSVQQMAREQEGIDREEGLFMAQKLIIPTHEIEIE